MLQNKYFVALRVTINLLSGVLHFLGYSPCYFLDSAIIYINRSDVSAGRTCVVNKRIVKRKELYMSNWKYFF